MGHDPDGLIRFPELFLNDLTKSFRFIQNRKTPIKGEWYGFMGSAQIVDQFGVCQGDQGMRRDLLIGYLEVGYSTACYFEQVQPNTHTSFCQMRAHNPWDNIHDRLRNIGAFLIGT